MQNRITAYLTFAVALLLLPSVPAFAQNASPGGEPAGKMSSSEMMRECREHCSAAHQSLDQASKTADEAKQSDDPAKMRSALQAISQSLAEGKRHMGMCLNMMSMMEHKGSMAGMKGMEGKESMEGMKGMEGSPSSGTSKAPY